MSLQIIKAKLNWQFDMCKNKEYTYVVDTEADITKHDWFIFIGKSLLCAESDEIRYWFGNDVKQIRIFGTNSYLPAYAAVKVVATDNPFCKKTFQEYLFDFNWESYKEWCQKNNFTPQPKTKTCRVENIKKFDLEKLQAYSYEAKWSKTRTLEKNDTELKNNNK